MKPLLDKSISQYVNKLLSINYYHRKAKGPFGTCPREEMNNRHQQTNKSLLINQQIITTAKPNGPAGLSQSRVVPL
jgi:hypothetical protein